MNKILDGLKIPANCSGIHVSILNEPVAKNRKIISFHKGAVPFVPRISWPLYCYFK